MKPISRHRWKGTVCLFLLIAVFQSCKKEVTEKDPGTRPSAKREITGSEAEGILKDIEQFYTYANEVKSHPGTIPVTLPVNVPPKGPMQWSRTFSITISPVLIINWHMTHQL